MKTLLKSRTVQFAFIKAISGILVAVLTQLDMVGYIVIVTAIADTLLRIDTTEKIEGIM
jgi:hypothetical protein